MQPQLTFSPKNVIHSNELPVLYVRHSSFFACEIQFAEDQFFDSTVWMRACEMWNDSSDKRSTYTCMKNGRFSWMNKSKEFFKWKMARHWQEHVYLDHTNICHLWKQTKRNNHLIEASFLFINMRIMATTKKNHSILQSKIALPIEIRLCVIWLRSFWVFALHRALYMCMYVYQKGLIAVNIKRRRLHYSFCQSIKLVRTQYFIFIIFWVPNHFQIGMDAIRSEPRLTAQFSHEVDSLNISKMSFFAIDTNFRFIFHLNFHFSIEPSILLRYQWEETRTI